MALGHLIDLATVLQLLTAHAESEITGITVVHPRDPDPDVAAWLRFACPRMEWLPRQRTTDEADQAEFEVDVFVCVGPPHDNAAALATAEQKIVVAFDGRTLRDAARSTIVNCRRCVAHGLVEFDEANKVEIGMVTIRGTCLRQSGRTVQDFLN